MRKGLWIVLLAALCVLPFSFVMAQESVYSDPAGQFTITIPTNWTATTADDGTAVLTDPDGQITVYAQVVVAPDVLTAIESGWALLLPEVEYAPQQTNEVPSAPGIEATLVVTQVTDDQTRVYQAFGQLLEGQIYLLLFDADLAAANQRAAQLNIIATGFTITALSKTDLSDTQPLPVDETIIAELEAFINQWQAEMNISGAVVAVVQDGKVVYEQGFGVTEMGGDTPITPETHMMIGSTGKSMTTLMMGTLVDDGLMEWDDPVIQHLPSFAVADPELTRAITMRNLVCACTGVPRRDLELLMNAQQVTAEDVVTSLQTFEFFTDFGEAFQYSNQMVATGGYAAAVAAGGSPDDLYNSYVEQMQQRVFDPIGMSHTTFSFESVEARGNFATPHGLTAFGEYQVIPLSYEQILTPVAPAGASWSTGHDMALYMLTELAKGVAPDGERIVSEVNLLETWKPQVAVSAESSYGLGWFIDEYKGVQLIEHGGNTLGFSTDFAFLPEKGVGILVITNAQASNAFNMAVRNRFLELIYQQPDEGSEGLTFFLEQQQDGVENFEKNLQTFTLEEVEPYLGTFSNDALGSITLTLDAEKLMVNAGEFQSELRKAINQATDKVAYIMVDPPLAGSLGFEFQTDEASNPIIVLDMVTDVYTFTRQG